MLDIFGNTWESLWEGAATDEAVGSVFTKPEVVDLILDLAGYRTGNDRLAAQPLLEPGCGDGAFVIRAVGRMLHSEVEHGGRIEWDDPVLDSAIRAADISSTAVEAVREQVAGQLIHAGCSVVRANELATRWAVRTDFLLHRWDRQFDFVVGNPPYVRIEHVPRRVLAAYRATFETISDRADLYVAFLEQGLRLLAPEGVLGFITANRFAKNQYGRAIRSFISTGYRVRYYLNLEHTQPFVGDVSAYPAIVVVDRQRGRPTRAATLESADVQTLNHVRTAALALGPPFAPLDEFAEWYPRGAPWVSTSGTEQERLARYVRRLAPLEDAATGTRIGIGVATGADRIFVLPSLDPEIETELQLPLVLARDVRGETIQWSGHHLLNPFCPADDGTLVSLADHPRFARYLIRHEEKLRSRHVAKGRVETWYRTIDRVWARLRSTPKLLIPDIQPADATQIALDDGAYYPHHNLYWITSEEWDLHALRALMRSSLVRAQVRAYSVQMRGGSLRWQAQTLRKIRIPLLSSLPAMLIDQLVKAHACGDPASIDAAAEEAFAASASRAHPS
jgi:methylase of polypeptide subunit release factors